MTSAAADRLDLLYVAHHWWLKDLFQRRTGCCHTAADLSHDVFVRLLGRSSLPAMREPRAYLARIAHGLLVDQRRRGALERAWLEALSELPHASMPSAEDHAVLLDALVRIDALLDGLNPRVREVFLRSRLDGQTYPTIARGLSVSLSTVEKDMARALRHCYQVMMA